MKTIIIVAVSQNQVIGSKGDLPWEISADLKNFKKLTTGFPILMGRKTFESIGKALPKRENIVITRQKNYYKDNIVVFDTIEKGIEYAKSLDKTQLFIIGGGEIYKQSLDLAQKIFLTKVNIEIEGDTFFPTLHPDQWQVINKESYQADEKNDYDFEILELDRK